MARLLIFGLGYTAKRIKAAVEELGWQVDATGIDGNIEFSDGEAVLAALEQASHVLSSIPPDRKTGDDPVWENYASAKGLCVIPGGWDTSPQPAYMVTQKALGSMRPARWGMGAEQRGWKQT